MMTLSAIWLLLLGKLAPELIRMVFGHNLHHMAPFGILEAGFCMVFRCASFWLLVPGTHCWTPGPKSRPRIWKLGPGWPGEVLEQKWGSEKHGFARGWSPNWRLWDFPRPKWIVWYPGGLWESQFPQKTLQKMVPLDFSQFGEIGGGFPCPPCVSPISPLWPYSPFVGSAAWPKALCIRSCFGDPTFGPTLGP